MKGSIAIFAIFVMTGKNRNVRTKNVNFVKIDPKNQLI